MTGFLLKSPPMAYKNKVSTQKNNHIHNQKEKRN